jgi:septal ring factor EnvC (AmiA/AmiB activator)
MFVVEALIHPKEPHVKVLQKIATVAVLGVVSVGAGPVAHADQPGNDAPCAAQEAKVAKAQDALDRVTAVFASKKDKVAEAQADVDAATTEAEMAKAEKRLAKAQEQAAKVKKEKKAQKQRLAKAEDRLADCEAAQAS